MKIFNISLTKQLGGLEQATIDYSNALEMYDHKVYNIISVNSKIHDKVSNIFHLPNLGHWCFLSRIYLLYLIYIHKPDVIIVHGGRAIKFTVFIKRFIAPPVICIAHSHKYKWQKKCDYIIALTKYWQNALIEYGYSKERIFLIPNMMCITHQYQKRKFHDPPVIGVFGRLVEDKGFKDFILAINLLRKKGCIFKALIAGKGPQKAELMALVSQLDLNNIVTFAGWIHDKSQFYKNIDIFCMSSLIEPFGIVLLEAMHYSTAIVATKNEGAISIIKDGENALLCNVQDPKDIALKLSMLLKDKTLAHQLSHDGYHDLVSKYDIKIVAKQINNVLIGCI